MKCELTGTINTTNRVSSIQHSLNYNKQIIMFNVSTLLNSDSLNTTINNKKAADKMNKK